jgi:fido (protein-threonine AMPylation protein)
MYSGYFVLAYQWDYRCHSLVESVRKKFQHLARELGELEHQDARNKESLLNYYKKWHYNKELYHITINEIKKRQFVIDSLGYRGYGVNRDLYGALGGIKNEYTHLHRILEERFKKYIDFSKRVIYLPQEVIDSLNSSYIITELYKKLNRNPEENIPKTAYPTGLNPDHCFRVMRKTPWPVNTAIFQKLFLNLGNSSMTITKGSMGYHNLLSPQNLKLIGNRNLLAMYKEIFSNLHNFTHISIDLLKRIHFVLSRDIDPNAGNFRTFDFPDKNGVTFDYGNFQREIGDLAHVLWETGQSFHSLDAFIYNLSRSYYMFIGIHPFPDSNGRVGRCFLNYMFLKKGIPPISFKDEDEIFALPRYGGSMEDMYNYIKTRIAKVVDSYFYERWKLENISFSKQIYNVSFDSGFHFRQIYDRPCKLEANFNAYLIDDSNPKSWQYQDQCWVVFPNEYLLYNMTIYCGFSHSRQSQWEHVFSLKNNFFIKEIRSDMPGIRIFDIDFVLEPNGAYYNYNYFNCCVVSHEGGRIFNNKGLNYSYRIEK